MPISAAKTPRSLRAFAFAALPLAAVVLGGATARWSEGIVLAVVGLVLLVVPPRASLGWKINAVLAGLLALAGTAFLPAAWFRTPAWRAALTDDLATVFPSTLGPQPWLSAESLVLFAGGVAWFYLMATVAWTADERPRAGRWFAGGVVALAAGFIVCARLHVALPIWHAERGFGSFPNRNQTADFLAVGALPVLACAHLAWRTRRRGVAGAWLAGWAVVAAGVFQDLSRAGVIILFAGTAAYVGNEALRGLRRGAPSSGDGSRQPTLGPWRTPALAASLVMLLACGFMVFGGETLGRFRSGGTGAPDATAKATAGDFRLQIQRDALDLIADSPWCGVGIGSFEGVFAPYRVRSAVDLHTVHPESDWVWLTAELGWPAFALVLVGAFLLARRIWPQRSGSDRPLRAAAAFAAALWALHGFVDVSAHRVGTAWCGLFLVGLALPGRGDAGKDFRQPAGWVPSVFRLLGLGLVAAGVLWIGAERGKWEAPGAQELARLASVSRAEAVTSQWQGSVATATRGLALDPVNWLLYYRRGISRLGAGEDHAAALADFRRALYLEPFSGTMAETMARNWARAGEPDLAVSALLEACRRVPADARGFFQTVAYTAGNNPTFFDRLAAATRFDPSLQGLYLETIPLPARGPALARIVAADPELRHYDDRQKAHLFRLWLSDPAALVALIDAHPAWQPVGWHSWARALANTGAPERACRVAAQYAPKPVVPPDSPGAEHRVLGELQIAAARSPGDLTAALRFARAQTAAGDQPGALATLHAAAVRPGSPAYFHYLEATAAADAGQWETAWEAWGRYLDTLPAES